MTLDSPNFAFLAEHDAQLAQQVAARTGYFTSAEEAQSDLLRRLKAERAVPYEVMDLFHQLRILGNSAVHEYAGEHLHDSTMKHINRGPFLSHAIALEVHNGYSKKPENSLLGMSLIVIVIHGRVMKS